MRIIKYIVIHCSATPQNTSVESIKRYWREDLHWQSPGYHYIIKPDGQMVKLAEEESISNGVAGYNSVSINVCYIGGIDDAKKPVDNRTVKQKIALIELLKTLRNSYSTAIIQGHRDFPNVKKACPCFDAKNEFSAI